MNKNGDSKTVAKVTKTFKANKKPAKTSDGTKRLIKKGSSKDVYAK